MLFNCCDVDSNSHVHSGASSDVYTHLAEPEWAGRLTDRDKKALSALIWSHINPYGTFHIDMSTHLDLGPATGHAQAA